MEIREITAGATYPVRHAVLRAGKPIESCRFDGDDEPRTVHLGLFTDGGLAAVATLLERQNRTLGSQKQFQLRGMAVLELHRGKGYGAALLHAAEQWAKDHGAQLLWFNARETAAGFYGQNGYKKSGPLFEIENVGPHYLMFRELL